MTSFLHPASWIHLDWVLLVVVAWLLIGVLGVLALRRFRLVAIVLFPVGALFSVLLLAVSLSAVFSDAGNCDPAARPAATPVPFAAGQPVGFLLDADRRRLGRRLGLCGGLLSPGRGHAARPDLPGVPRVSGQHCHGGAGRRCLCLHGGVGNHGVFFLLSGAGQSPHSRNPQRRLPLHADRAHRRFRHPAVFRFAAGQHRRLHLCQHARAAPDAVLGLAGICAGGVWFWRQGGPVAAARLAARGASGGTVTFFGPDERRHAQDRALRHSARFVRPAAGADLVVGRAADGRWAWSPPCLAWCFRPCRWR